MSIGPRRFDPLDDDTTDVAGPAKWNPEWSLPKDDEAFHAEMNKVPLFMRQYDNTDNVALEALQSLAYDGTPTEVAENFKNQGNDAYATKMYKDAIEFYTKAIGANAGNVINEACYANRAACHLALQNYGSTIRDCSSVLKINPSNIKALYRSGKAFLALEKIDEALAVVKHALGIKQDAAVLALQEEIRTKSASIQAKHLARQQRDLEKKKQTDLLEATIKSRNINIKTSPHPPDNPHPVHLVDSSLIWPVMLLYPEASESDFITNWNEQDPFASHLDIVFEQPAPWDKDHRYRPANVDVYFESNNGSKLVRVGRNITLGKVLSLPSYEVIDGIPNFIILSKDGKFRDEFIGRYKK